MGSGRILHRHKVVSSLQAVLTVLGYTGKDPVLCAWSSFQLKQKYPVITHRGVFISFLFLFFFFLNKSIMRSLEMYVKPARDDLRIRDRRCPGVTSKEKKILPGREGDAASSRGGGAGGVTAAAMAPQVAARPRCWQRGVPEQSPHCCPCSCRAPHPFPAHLHPV